MARSDLILNLIRSKVSGDERLFRQSVEAMIAEEHGKQHHVLADQLTEALNTKNHNAKESLYSLATASKLLTEINPQKKFDDLILSDSIVSAFEELVEEQYKVELLRAYNLEPRHKILLYGLPGNGKTSVAEAFAEALSVPLLVVRYDSLITSFLGETNQRLSTIFDFVRTRRCVLFFDEFDVVGKERGDSQETGEIKRLVSSLLLQIDQLPSHVVTIVATNHPELLDRAVWRRFEVRQELTPPKQKEIKLWLNSFQDRSNINLSKYIPLISAKFSGKSYSELENFSLDILRKYILQSPDSSLDKIIKSTLQSDKKIVKKKTSKKLNAKK